MSSQEWQNYYTVLPVNALWRRILAGNARRQRFRSSPAANMLFSDCIYAPASLVKQSSLGAASS